MFSEEWIKKIVRKGEPGGVKKGEVKGLRNGKVKFETGHDGVRFSPLPALQLITFIFFLDAGKQAKEKIIS